MEKPALPNTLPSSKSSQTQPTKNKDNNNNNNAAAAAAGAGGGQKRKLPTAQDLISHYESQGLETKEASLKVIDDLQNMLFRVVTSGRGKKDRFMSDSSRKLDNVHTRLAVVEMKVDSKPGYGESLAIGVAAGAVLKGIGFALPHVLGAVGDMWNAVTKSSSSTTTT